MPPAPLTGSHDGGDGAMQPGVPVLTDSPPMPILIAMGGGWRLRGGLATRLIVALLCAGMLRLHDARRHHRRRQTCCGRPIWPVSILIEPELRRRRRDPRQAHVRRREPLACPGLGGRPAGNGVVRADRGRPRRPRVRPLGRLRHQAVARPARCRRASDRPTRRRRVATTSARRATAARARPAARTATASRSGRCPAGST